MPYLAIGKDFFLIFYQTKHYNDYYTYMCQFTNIIYMYLYQRYITFHNVTCILILTFMTHFS